MCMFMVCVFIIYIFVFIRFGALWLFKSFQRPCAHPAANLVEAQRRQNIVRTSDTETQFWAPGAGLAPPLVAQASVFVCYGLGGAFLVLCFGGVSFCWFDEGFGTIWNEN